MKYTIVLCFFAAFACSTQVHAGILTDLVDGPVQKVQNAVENVIRNEMLKLEAAADSYEDRVNKQVAETEKEIARRKSEVQSKVKYVLDQNTVQLNRINQLSSERGLNLSICETIARKVENDTTSLTLEATECVTDRLKSLKERANPLQEKVKKMHDVFVHHLQVNRDCVNNPNSGGLKKMACVVDNKIKATYEVTTRLPGLLAEKAKFLTSEMFAPVRGFWCMSENKFSASVKQLEYSVKDVEQCVADELKKSEENSKVTVPNVPNPEVVPTENEVNPTKIPKEPEVILPNVPTHEVSDEVNPGGVTEFPY